MIQPSATSRTAILTYVINSNTKMTFTRITAERLRKWIELDSIMAHTYTMLPSPTNQSMQCSNSSCSEILIIYYHIFLLYFHSNDNVLIFPTSVCAYVKFCIGISLIQSSAKNVLSCISLRWIPRGVSLYFLRNVIDYIQILTILMEQSTNNSRITVYKG